MTDLVKLGRGCQLDVDKLIAGRLLLQANSGGGKSYAVRKLCEITHGHAQQIIIDVDGEYHTLREKFDYVLAGKDGDCAATIQSAALLARRLLELNVSAIIDIYELGIQRALFIKRFLDSLVNAPRDLWHPAIIVIDEAHKWAPEGAKCESTSAVVDLMTLGRKRGFAGVLATQRISKLSKDAAAECNLKLIGRSAIDIDMKRSSDEIGMVSKTQTRTLRTLHPGEFYAIGFETETFLDQQNEKYDAAPLIQVGSVITTHLKAGERSTKPAPASAKVRKILGQLDDLPHEAEQELTTVVELRTKVRQLEGELRKAPKVAEPKVVERSIVKPQDLARIETVIDRTDKIGSRLLALGNELTATLRKAAPVGDTIGKPYTSLAVQRPKNPLPEPKREATLRVTNGQIVALKGGPRKILEALIQHQGKGCTLQQLTVLTGYKATSRYEFLRQLKGHGYAEEQGDRHHVTHAGLAALPDVHPLPTGGELRQLAMNRVTGGQRLILEALINAYPGVLTNNDLEAAAGCKVTSRYEFVRKLVAQELVVIEGHGTRASDNLFD